MLSVMGAFAEFERALIGERQREGIALAKKGRHRTGQKTGSIPRTEKVLAEVQAAELARRAVAGESKAAFAREYGISRETVYQYIRPKP
jgi:DNA invertase Pin-like site-specific DNA recombinase